VYDPCGDEAPVSRVVGVYAINGCHATAGIGKAGRAIGVQVVLVNEAGHVGSQLLQAVQQLFAGVFGLIPLRDVAADAQHAQQLALAVTHGRLDGFQHFLVAVTGKG
jgi:hypothetical protein